MFVEQCTGFIVLENEQIDFFFLLFYFLLLIFFQFEFKRKFKKKHDDIFIYFLNVRVRV